MRFGMWRHIRKGHNITTNKLVSVPAFDIGAKGWLHRCSCGKVWAA